MYPIEGGRVVKRLLSLCVYVFDCQPASSLFAMSEKKNRIEWATYVHACCGACVACRYFEPSRAELCRVLGLRFPAAEWECAGERDIAHRTHRCLFVSPPGTEGGDAECDSPV